MPRLRALAERGGTLYLAGSNYTDGWALARLDRRGPDDPADRALRPGERRQGVRRGRLPGPVRRAGGPQNLGARGVQPVRRRRRRRGRRRRRPPPERRRDAAAAPRRRPPRRERRRARAARRVTARAKCGETATPRKTVFVGGREPRDAGRRVRLPSSTKKTRRFGRALGRARHQRDRAARRVARDAAEAGVARDVERSAPASRSSRRTSTSRCPPRRRRRTACRSPRRRRDQVEHREREMGSSRWSACPAPRSAGLARASSACRSRSGTRSLKSPDVRRTVQLVSEDREAADVVRRRDDVRLARCMRAERVVPDAAGRSRCPRRRSRARFRRCWSRSGRCCRCGRS